MSAPIRRVSPSQRPVFLLNSRLARLFVASITSPTCVGRARRPFSRSYGAILPSSFSRVLPIALVFSTCPPVSVLVRARPTSLDAFLGGMASRTSAFAASASRLRLDGRRISLSPALRGYPRSTIAWVSLAYPVPPSVIAVGTWYRNINLLSIAYALRPRLRSRLTLRRLA